MLLYGGLVPSRIHCDTEESLQKRLTELKDIRKRNPEMVIYGFQVVMRCPNYSSSDEEPDYYEIYGAQIHKAGEVLHKDRLGISHKVLMYPGADEVGLTLISRILNHLYEKKPKIYVKYASEKSKYMPWKRMFEVGFRAGINRRNFPDGSRCFKK